MSPPLVATAISPWAISPRISDTVVRVAPAIHSPSSATA